MPSKAEVRVLVVLAQISATKVPKLERVRPAPAVYVQINEGRAEAREEEAELTALVVLVFTKETTEEEALPTTVVKVEVAVLT